MVSQCVLFFIAGYDTTATTLSMTAYNLALYPECQDKLIEEIDSAMEKHVRLLLLLFFSDVDDDVMLTLLFSG